MATVTPLPAKHTPEWTLSDRMWKARKDAGLTAAQIAALIGISRKSVTNYETGTTKPLRPILKAWAEVTGTYVEWLEHGTAPFPRRLADDVANRRVTGDNRAHERVTYTLAA